VKGRKFPLPLDPDLTGKVKMETLQFFAFSLGWHSPKDAYADPFLEEPLYESEWRCLSIRLLRYYRQGLLRRRRRSRSFEYSITTKGEDRLIYLWEKLGYLDFDRKLTEPEKRLVEIRARKAISILKKHEAIIDAKEVSLDQEFIEAERRSEKLWKTEPNNLSPANAYRSSTRKLNRTPHFSTSESFARLIDQTKPANVKREQTEQ
jgi:hypothetical protein